MGRARWCTAALVGVLALAGCGLPDAAADDGVLEPMHGTIDPDVLTRRAEPATPAPPPTTDDSAHWRVANVIDGRTLELYQGLDRATATLAGIEVPTGDDCLVQRATDSLAFITGGNRSFEVTPANATNGRIDDATIVGDEGEDLAAVMLSLGLARATGDGPDPSGYRDAEEAARDGGMGVWSDDCDR
jgi:endonuclease YncB( thermonuclease family)